MAYKTLKAKAVKFIDSTEEIRRSLKFQNMPKKQRTKLNEWQIKVLEEAFSVDSHPSSKVKNRLAKDLQLALKSVQIWFQNKRAKEKAKHEREEEGSAEEELPRTPTGKPRLEYKFRREYDQEYCVSMFRPQPFPEPRREERPAWKRKACAGSHDDKKAAHERCHKNCMRSSQEPEDPWHAHPFRTPMRHSASPAYKPYAIFPNDMFLSQYNSPVSYTSPAHLFHEYDMGANFMYSPSRSPRRVPFVKNCTPGRDPSGACARHTSHG